MEVEVDGSRSKTGSQPRVKADGGGHATLPACLRTFIFNLLFLGRLVCQCFVPVVLVTGHLESRGGLGCDMRSHAGGRG